MTVIEIVSAVIMLLLCIAVVYSMFRNDKVAKFRLMIINEDYEDSMRNLHNDVFTTVDNYSRLPSYSRMVWSFKPLKKKYWL